MSAPELHRFSYQSLSLWCLDPFEAEVLSGDVDLYFDQGITLSRGATVLDVGANIGLFSAAVYLRLGGDVRLYAFEPLPPILEVLGKNAADGLAGKMTVCPYGLGTVAAEIDFNYYPLLSCLSSSHRGEAELAGERKRIAAACFELIKSGRVMPHLAVLPDVLLLAMADSYVATRLRPQIFRGQIRPFSEAVDGLGVGAIDLLKIDVEGAELEVLAGIQDRHWPQIRQLVVEVEQWTSRLDQVSALFEGHGFAVAAVQDAAMAAGDYGLVFGLRR